MTIDERTQADMLEEFLLNPAAPPPDGLDAGVAATATLLSQRLTPAGPTPEFVRKLEQQLTTSPADNQTGPATITDWKPRSRRSELLRIAAAGLVILLLGSLLIYLFSNQDDRPQVASPGGFTDGEILVSWDPTGRDNYKLYIVPTDGSDPRKLTPGPHEDDGVVEVGGVWSPDGRWVAYMRAESDSGALYIAPVDQHVAPINLTPEMESHGVYGWSPDGRQILFSSHAQVHVINADGTNVRKLTDHWAGAVYGAWSPDGEQITFVGMGPEVRVPSGTTRDQRIWVMDADGNNHRPVADLEYLFEDPVWSPDGQWIAFWYERDIWIVSPTGGDMINLTNVSGDNMAGVQPAWANNQNWIAHLSGNMEHVSRDIVIIGTDGNVVHQWTAEADNLRTPSWSPDDQHFVYLAGDLIDPDSPSESPVRPPADYNWRLEIATIEGENRRTILEGSFYHLNGSPPWNPAGRSTPPGDESLSPPTKRAGWPNAARIWQGEVSQVVVHTSGACDWFDYPVCNEEPIWMIPVEPMETTPTEPVAFRVDGLDDVDVEIVSIQAVPISDESALTVVDDEMVLLDPARGEIAEGTSLSVDDITFLPNLPPGDYVIGVEVRHTPTEGTAYFGFHVRIQGEPVVDVTSTPEPTLPSRPESTPDAEPARTFEPHMTMPRCCMWCR